MSPDRDALWVLLGELRADLGVGRCTLRQPAEDDFFPVSHEVLAAGAPAIAGDRTVDLRTQPVPRRLAAGERQVVQTDCASASDEPAFQAMLQRYGGLRAQVVTAIHGPDGDLRGILSVHDLRAPRPWSPDDLARIDQAAAAIREVLA